MSNDILNSSKAPEPVGAYPHARKVGNLLFLSGVGPRERGTKIIPGVELDAEGEYRELRYRKAMSICVQQYQKYSGRLRKQLGQHRRCNGFLNKYER